MAKDKRITSERVPSWLFFALIHEETLGRGWTEAKDLLARRIIKQLKQKAESAYWPDEVLKNVLYINKYDNVKGYYAESK